MSQKQWVKRFLWTGLGCALLGGLIWWRLESNKVSYPDPSANPSFHKLAVKALPADQRPPMAAFSFQAPDGTQRTFQQFAGSVTLVNLWATWCPPCVAEMPDLDVLRQTWRDHPMRIAAISVDRGGTAIAQRWLDAHGLRSLELYSAPASVVNGGVLPTTYLLDKKGRIAWMGVGMQDWLGPDTQQTLHALLAEE